MLKKYKIGNTIISFDEERHRFWDEKGNPIPSVSTITSIIDKSPQLMSWAVKITGNYFRQNFKPQKLYRLEEIEELILLSQKEYQRKKTESADIGTQIHEWIDQWIKGVKQSIPEDARVVNGIQAFLKFQKEYKIKWIESEKVVYSKKYGFAGFLDAVGKSGKDLILFDFKSSNGIYPEYALQTAGYQIAYEEETKKKINYRMIIRFGKENGEFEFKEFKNNDEDKDAFLNLLNIKNWLNKIKI